VSPRLPTVRPRQLVRALERKGGRHDRTTGSHNKNIGRGLLGRILQDAEISRDEFLKLL
jgi:predicted RNA binding protein YcfA (HicA-like mRNA interferase family)